MNKHTLKGLIGSVEKWHNIVYHDEEDLGITNCPLCNLFYGSYCKECPVLLHTGQLFCRGSPYEEYHNCRHTYGNDCKKLAYKELEFLVQLLPSGVEAKMQDGWIWYWRWEDQ